MPPVKLHFAKVTDTEFNALVVYEPNTLYMVSDSANGSIMNIHISNGNGLTAKHTYGKSDIAAEVAAALGDRITTTTLVTPLGHEIDLEALFTLMSSGIGGVIDCGDANA
jgi:hypothetical protein